MTYFLRDDNGPYDLMMELESNAWHEAMVLAANHGQEIGCLFEGTENGHDPRHPKDFKFRVRMEGCVFWEELTERQIVDRGHGWIAGSQWDHWYEG